jgi:hypothetical protein
MNMLGKCSTVMPRNVLGPSFHSSSKLLLSMPLKSIASKAPVTVVRDVRVSKLIAGVSSQRWISEPLTSTEARRVDEYIKFKCILGRFDTSFCDPIDRCLKQINMAYIGSIISFEIIRLHWHSSCAKSWMGSAHVSTHSNRIQPGMETYHDSWG